MKFFIAFILIVFSANAFCLTLHKDSLSVINEEDIKNKELKLSQFENIWHNIHKTNNSSSDVSAIYSISSFLESEIFRKNRNRVILSNDFIFYHCIIDKIENYVNNRGMMAIDFHFSHAFVNEVINKYGILPYSEFHNDNANYQKILDKISNQLTNAKDMDFWDSEKLVKSAEIILQSELGILPEIFVYETNFYTSISFYESFYKSTNMDIVGFVSKLDCDFNSKCDNYYNLDLIDYMNLFHKAISSGYSVSMTCDKNQIGYHSDKKIAYIPSFDIPGDYIDNNARQFRVSNNTTQKNYSIHVVGYRQEDDGFWYLVKNITDDSEPEYMYYHQDYIKLKSINYLVNVDPAREFLDKIIK